MGYGHKYVFRCVSFKNKLYIRNSKVNLIHNEKFSNMYFAILSVLDRRASRLVLCPYKSHDAAAKNEYYAYVLENRYWNRKIG